MCNTKMERDARDLGAISTNLLTLEHQMRCFIARKEGFDCSSISFNDLKKGYIVPNPPEALKLNSFTNVLTEFNKIVDAENQIDSRLIGIRNDLAHGEIIGETPFSPEDTVKLVKFDRANVKVTNAIDLTNEWLEKTLKYTQKAIIKLRDLDS